MGRSPLFTDLKQAMRITLYCKKNQISIAQGLERIAEIEARKTQELTPEDIAGATVNEVGLAARQLEMAYAASHLGSGVKIGIVGAGLAGLACGYELKQHGIFATVYEASHRVGGRCFSLGGAFPGAVNFPNQAIERGGELIDSKNKMLLHLAQKFHLRLEDSQQPGEVACYFNGQQYSPAAVMEEYREFLEVIDVDLQSISSTPVADNHTNTDVLFDKTNLLEYLESRQAGKLIKAAINACYMAEYGLELEEQSCLNFLLVIRDIDKSKASPFEIFSDERYHIIGGNEQIVRGLSNELQGQIHLGMRLVRVRKNSMNRIEVTFNDGARTTTVEHDAVVLAIPFPLLRQVELDPSLELPAWKLEAIAKLDNATHAKMMLGFGDRPWIEHNSNGVSYSNLPNHQATWETNPTQATNGRGVLVDYSSGRRGAKLNPDRVQVEAEKFLGDLERIYPGAIAKATRDRAGKLLVHLEHWPSNPLAQGSYACYRPGQFTAIAGHEGKAINNLFFAGEHTNSFYEWQGYMEGAVLSGMKAAREIFQHFKLKVLRC